MTRTLIALCTAMAAGLGSAAHAEDMQHMLWISVRGEAGPMAGAAVAVGDPEVRMVKAATVSPGLFVAAVVGDKATIELWLDGGGSSVLEVVLPPATPLLADIQVLARGPQVTIGPYIGSRDAALGGCGDPATGDCCLEGGNGTPFCDDMECCDLVCSIDPFCCDVSWDGICADEAQDMCAVCMTGPCGDPAAGDCCESNGSPGCDDADCCDAVCAADPLCCDTTWDATCADSAVTLCGDLCGGPCPGEGDCCEDNGTPGCDDAGCCDAVCGIDPFCCDVSWDGICAGEAEDLCGDLCGADLPNDDCADAIPVELGSTVSGSTVGAADDPEAGSSCGTSITAGGVWYSVIGDGSTITASTCNQADYDTKISVFCGDCAAGLACVGGQDDTSGCGGFSTEFEWCSQNGAEYLILIHGFSGAQGTFDLTVSSDGVPCTADVECLPTGACCLVDGTCLDANEAECDAEGGLFFPGESCSGLTGDYVVADCANPFEDISGTGIEAPTASTSDDGGDVVPIGFTFNFFGDDHTEVGVASNGYLTFGTDLGDFTPDPIPSTTEPNDLIAPYWDDWSPNQSGTVHYQTLAGPTRFIAQWTDVPNFNTGGTATFQAVLYEGTDCIEYRYGSPLELSSPVVGIENQDGTDGLAVAPIPVSGDCVQICPEEGQGFECPVAGAALDIKPGSCPNPVNRNSNGVIPVALLGTDTFDAADVDITTLLISRADGVGGSVGPNEGPPGPHTVLADVGTPFDGDPCDCHTLTGDGLVDVSMKFRTQDVVEALLLNDLPNGSTVELCVSGTLTDGTSFEACDCIVLVPPAEMAMRSNLPAIPLEVFPPDDYDVPGGVTPFVLSYPQTSVVTLTAPLVPAGDTRYILDGWWFNGELHRNIGTTITVTVDEESEWVLPIYRLKGVDFGAAPPAGSVD